MRSIDASNYSAEKRPFSILGKFALGGLLTVLILNALALIMFADGLAFGALDKLIAKKPTALQDFIKYYTCGKIALSNKRSDAYEPDVQNGQLQETLRGLDRASLPKQYLFPTDYPPPVYPIMGILAMLPINQALGLWWIISLVSAVIGTYMLRQHKLKETALLLLWSASSLAAWRTVGMGQTSWIILGTISLFFYCFFAKRDIGCGIALAISMLKLQYAPFLLIPLIVAKRWRAAYIAGLIVLLLTACALILMGPQILLSYFHSIFKVETTDPYLATMICLKGLLSYVLPEPSLSTISMFGMIAGIISCTYVWKYSVYRSAETQLWAAAFTISMALLASLHTQNYDLLLLTVAAALTIPKLGSGKLYRSLSSPLLLWNILLISFPIISWLLTQIPIHGYFGQSIGFFLFLLTTTIAALLNMLQTNNQVFAVKEQSEATLTL